MSAVSTIGKVFASTTGAALLTTVVAKTPGVIGRGSDAFALQHAQHKAEKAGGVKNQVIDKFYALRTISRELLIAASGVALTFVGAPIARNMAKNTTLHGMPHLLNPIVTLVALSLSEIAARLIFPAVSKKQTGLSQTTVPDALQTFKASRASRLPNPADKLHRSVDRSNLALVAFTNSSSLTSNPFAVKISQSRNEALASYHSR